MSVSFVFLSYCVWCGQRTMLANFCYSCRPSLERWPHVWAGELAHAVNGSEQRAWWAAQRGFVVAVPGTFVFVCLFVCWWWCCVMTLFLFPLLLFAASCVKSARLFSALCVVLSFVHSMRLWLLSFYCWLVQTPGREVTTMCKLAGEQKNKEFGVLMTASKTSSWEICECDSHHFHTLWLLVTCTKAFVFFTHLLRLLL